MSTDRRTSIRASQLRNFSVTGYDIKNASISGSEKLIDGSVTDAKLNDSYILANGTRAFTSPITGVTPIASTDLATKGYIDTVSGSVDHGGLLGLSDDDHPQYVDNTEMTTISGDLQTNIDAISGGVRETATANVAAGTNAGDSITTGDYNTSFGYDAGTAITEGLSNTAAGAYALDAITTGDYNTAVGQDAGGNNVTGVRNTIIGYQAGLGAAGQSYNDCVFVSAAAGLNNKTGGRNIAIGYAAMVYNEGGSYNTCIGYRAGQGASAQDQVNNTFIGYQAGYANTTGTPNVAVGINALYACTEGINNTAVGAYALDAITDADYCTAVGSYALTSNTTGFQNTAVGDQCMSQNTTGKRTVAMGYCALLNGSTGGDYNVVIGHYAGQTLTTGTNNTLIGAGADVSAAAAVNRIAIGKSASSDADNKVVIGNSSNTTVGGYNTWSNYSDRRLKQNIVDSNIGLDFILKLRTRRFERIANPDRMWDGFIAQEVKEAIDECEVEFSGYLAPEKEENMAMVSYETFVVPIVNALKELKSENDNLKERMRILENRS